MSKVTELTIDVNVKMGVSDEMAERCLMILEMWQNDNANKVIFATREEDGRTRFKIKPLEAISAERKEE